MDTKDYNGAINDFTKSIKIHPNYDAYYNRGVNKYIRHNYIFILLNILNDFLYVF